VRISTWWTGLALSAVGSLFGALPSEAQQASTTSTPVVVPVPVGPGGLYAWAGESFINSFAGSYVGGIYALNGNLGSEGVVVRLEGIGGQYTWNTVTLPNANIETYNGAALLGYKKQVGTGWVSAYLGAAFETHNNPDVGSPLRLHGTEGGGRALVDYWGPLVPNQLEVYASASYATPFKTTNLYGRLIAKLSDKISIGPESAYFSNEVAREGRVGGFISFKTAFGELAFSGGYRDPFTPGPSGYYANVYLGFERFPGTETASPAGLPYKAAVVAPAVNWSGLYAGGQAGLGWDSVEFSNVALGDSIRSKAFGFAGGGQVGYNWQVGQWVVGVEADLLGANLKNTQPSPILLVVTPYTSKIDVIGTVVGRLGYAKGRSLFYVDGGWATARLAIAGQNNIIGDTFATRAYEDGWTIGAGWDYALDKNWILGVDYKRIELGKTTRTGLSNLALPFTISDIDPKINVLTLRLSYKFGDWGKSPVVAKY
jgi:outer membrane immunogenic protein